MGRRSVFIKAILALVLVWAVVWGVRSWAGSRKVTAEKVTREISAVGFADRSAGDGTAGEMELREKEIRRIADMTNRLDFQEREKNRENRSGEEFYKKLSPRERSLFVDLTVMESMGRFMKALDELEQQCSFVKVLGSYPNTGETVQA